jgi:RNA polymerase sigma factor (sigma-70 family)
MNDLALRNDDDVADVRVEVRVRNNLILRAMEQRGIKSVNELAKQMKAKGYSASQSILTNLVAMKQLPEKLNEGWRRPVQELAEFLQCLPEDLFSRRQRKVQLDRNRFEAETTFVQAMALSEAAPSPGAEVDRKQFQQVLNKVLSQLTAREERVLRLRFGFDGEPQTLEEIAKQFGVTKERIRGLEHHAIRKLHHISRARHLMPFLEDFGIPKPSQGKITELHEDYVRAVYGSQPSADQPESASRREVIVICEHDECFHTLDFEFSGWPEFWNLLQKCGWRSRVVNDQWVHYCPDHCKEMV